MAVTINKLAVNLRITTSVTQQVEEPYLSILTSILNWAIETVDSNAPQATESAKDLAVYQLSAYLYDKPQASRGLAYSNAWANSGAANILRRWIQRRAIIVDEPSTNGAGTPGGGTPSGIDRNFVINLIDTAIARERVRIDSEIDNKFIIELARLRTELENTLDTDLAAAIANERVLINSLILSEIATARVDLLSTLNTRLDLHANMPNAHHTPPDISGIGGGGSSIVTTEWTLPAVTRVSIYDEVSDSFSYRQVPDFTLDPTDELILFNFYDPRLDSLGHYSALISVDDFYQFPVRTLTDTANNNSDYHIEVEKNTFIYFARTSDNGLLISGSYALNFINLIIHRFVEGSSSNSSPGLDTAGINALIDAAIALERMRVSTEIVRSIDTHRMLPNAHHTPPDGGGTPGWR